MKRKNECLSVNSCIIIARGNLIFDLIHNASNENVAVVVKKIGLPVYGMHNLIYSLPLLLLGINDMSKCCAIFFEQVTVFFTEITQ